MSRVWDVRITVTKIVRVTLSDDLVDNAGEDLPEHIYTMAEFHEVWSTAEVMEEETDAQIIKEVV